MTLQHDLEFDDPEEFDKRLRDAHSLAKLGLWEFEPSTGISRWSLELFDIYERDTSLGYFTKEEFDARLHPDEKKALNVLEQRALDFKEPYTYDHSFSFPDGRVKYLTQSVKPLINAHGKVTKIYGITQDITDRKIAEIALEESRELIGSIAGAIPDALFVFDIIESKLVYTNSNFIGDLGYSIEDIKQYPNFMESKVLHEEDRYKWPERAGKLHALQDGEVLDTEYRAIAKDGSERWYRNTEKVFKRDENGNVKLVIGTTHDTTVRKRQESQIRENSQLMDAMLSNLPLVAFKMDKDGVIITSKGEGLRAAGIADNQNVGRNVMEMYPATADKFKAALDGKMFRFHSDGGAYGKDWYYDNYIFKDPNNKGGLIGIGWEISETKRIEKALIEEKKKVEEVADIKQQFVSAMSHEIRTPMNGVIGMTNLLIETALNEEQHEYVSLIRESADNLLVIINDILDFSKLSAGMMTLQKVEFDLSDLVSNAVKLLKHKAHLKKLKFSVSKDTQIPSSVIGDPIRLRQVLLNLLGNALKFTDKGEIQLSADVVEWQDKKVVVKFEVSDTGVGIPQDKLNTIFDNFIQVVDSSTHGQAGTGLGLSIAKQLVEAQHGTIGVKSELGRGSTFTFTLAFDFLGETKLDNKAKGTATSATLNGTRLLLVEDNPINQKVAKLTLEKMGASVVVAENGLVALGALDKAEFDLIIMDIQMPVMNGFEATRHIRERNDAVSKLPIIAMTASAMAGEKDKCIAAGMTDFVSKPFTRDDILAAINACLQPKPEKSVYPSNMDVEMVTIDLNYLRQLQDDDDFLAGIIEDFLETTPECLVQLKAAAEQDNFAKIRELSHKAKQGYQVLGIKEAVADWDWLEHNASAATKPEVSKATQRLHEMSKEAFKALESILTSFK